MQLRTTSLLQTFAAIDSPRSFALSPDGSTLAFTLEAGQYTQIFTLETARPGFPRRVTATLGNCSDPQWSPDSCRLTYIQDKALWTINADGTNPRQLTENPAGNSDPFWSPDGTRIAFYSRRRGWEHVWTIPVAGGTPVQVTAGESDGVDIAWAPDSQSLAFCSAREEDLSTRGIYLVPALGGSERLISPRGAWSGSPHFSPDGRQIAYLSDRDGWFHVYIYDCSSESTRQLTSGEFEDGGPHFYIVDMLGGPIFSPDGQRLAFVRHREGSFDVWMLDVQSGDAERISRQVGQYRILGWLPDGTHLAVVHEDIARVPDAQILAADGSMRVLTDSSTAEMKSDSMIAPEWVTYLSRDGLTIHAGLLRPREESTKMVANGRHPAVLFLHGGPNFQFGDYFYPLPELLAQEGYVVLAPNYRGSTGYGREFRQANFCEWAHADALDVVDGARWLQQQSFVDPQRIAIVGPSYGGYLTLAVLTLEPELFCAGVDLYGDSEIAESYRHGDRYGRMDLRRHMGTPEENPEGYRRGSPVYLAERIQAPLLFLHGKNDMLVVPLMSEKMIEALKIESKYYEAHFYEDEEHGFSKPENKQDAWTRILDFLNRFATAP